MKKLISALKQIRIGQILTICLASLLIFVSTACGSGSELKAQAQTSDQVKEEVPEGAETSPLEGGMNEFPDTDPRRDTNTAGSEASSLVKAAQQNIDKKSASSPGEYTENYRKGAPIGERVQNVNKSVGDATKGVTEDFAKGTQRGFANLTGNTQSAAKGAQQAAEETSDVAKSKTSKATKDIQQAAENVPGQVGGD